MRKKVQRKVKRAVTNFFQQEASSGMTLLVCAVVAMLIANTSLGPVYEHLLQEIIVQADDDFIRHLLCC